MRKALLGVLLIGAVLIISGDGWGQTARGGIFWAPNPSRHVTISQDGATVASLLLPAGTFMSASYDEQQQNLITAGRWEFRGDVTLRVQPAATAPGQPPGRRATEIMSRPPITLTLSAVDVLIENVAP
jgi:hypothetical protein